MENDGKNQTTTQDILKERGSRYGTFANHAKCSSALREAFFTHQMAYGQAPLTATQTEAIILILHKLARIANGDPNYDDNWIDLCGYSQLVVDDLNGTDSNNTN